MLFCCSKSKQGTLVKWGKTRRFIERGHENKREGSNGPVPTMTSWQNAMTSNILLLAISSCFALLSYLFFFPPPSESYIFGEKEDKDICKPFLRL